MDGDDSGPVGDDGRLAELLVDEMKDEVIVRLIFVLLQKLREVPADDMEKVRWYIKEIKGLFAHPDEPPAVEVVLASPMEIMR